LQRAQKKQQKKILVPKLLSITYVGTSIMSSAAVGIVPKSAQKNIEHKLCVFWLKEPQVKI